MASIAAATSSTLRHAIDPADQSLFLVEGQDRRGLGAIFGHAGADRLLIVVGPALEFMPAADVAGALDLGRWKLVVIAARRNWRR